MAKETSKGVVSIYAEARTIIKESCIIDVETRVIYNLDEGRMAQLMTRLCNDILKKRDEGYEVS